MPHHRRERACTMSESMVDVGALAAAADRLSQRAAAVADVLSREKTPQSSNNGGGGERRSSSQDGREGGREREESERERERRRREREKEEDEEYFDRLSTAKLKARSEIRLSQWDQYKFADLDLDKVLGVPADNCPRVHVDDYTPARFVKEFEDTCKPVIIRGAMERWPAMRKWDMDFLERKYGEIKLKCGEDDDGNKVKIRLKHFLRYQRSQRDDSPLYCFDADYGDSGKETRPLLDDFDVPEYFREDLFQYVGEERRPPYKWFLLGPKRSGSSIHLDPLATSAWNAVISGRKRWVMFPPGTPKSLIKPEKWLDRDDHEAIDWFLLELEGIKKSLPKHQQPIECIQYPGEIIYVPGGWWHTVLNMEDSLAITQNFASTSCFQAVWLDTRKSRIKLARSWLRKLHEIRPDLYTIAQNLAGNGDGKTTTAERDLEERLKDRHQKKAEKKERKRRERERKKEKKRKRGSM